MWRTQISSDAKGISNLLHNYHHIQQEVIGKINSDIQFKNGKYNFILELHSIAEFSVTGNIRFSTSINDLQYGDIIRTIAFIRKIDKPGNPSLFDAEKYYQRKNIHAVGYNLNPIEVLENQSDPLRRFVFNLRSSALKRIEARFPYHSGFVKAITIADKSDLEDLRPILTRAGLSHLLAVSGLHVGLLAMVFFQLLIIIFPRNVARILLIIILILYGFLCDWSPSVFRAIIMISLFLLAGCLQRKTNANNILFCSFLIITIIRPFEIYSAGFQMSFQAVFVLLNLMPQFRFLKISKHDIFSLSFLKKTLNYFLIIFFSSFILNIFLAPITLYHFQQFGLNGSLGNLIGIPLMALILPLAILIIFLPPFPPLIQLYQNSFSHLMLIFLKFTGFAARLPAHFDFIYISFWQLLLIYLCLAILILILKYFNSRRSRFLTVLLLLCVTSLYISFQAKDKFHIFTFFDCGLGDLSLIETSSGQNIMIDTGPAEPSSGFFTRSALPYLKMNNLRDIDLLFLTHAHNDHYGGISAVLQETNLRKLAVSDEFTDSNVWNSIEQLLLKEGTEIIIISDTISFYYDDLHLKVLHPDRSFSDSNINNYSIVISAVHQNLKILFMGDLEAEGEHYLLINYPQYLSADILKAGHHGSKTASSNHFVNVVTPRMVVISTAMKNHFNFPHEETLSTFSYLENGLFITGFDGAIQVRKRDNLTIIKSHKTEKILQLD
jgi:competence protein ComEC